ncbi:MAG TPA: HAMP domain-containing sensor histidine kinase [Gemmataceae bacterium]|nr:HAMP domain-containing sensor histidine kinase [Gemmataceae bacterium]
MKSIRLSMIVYFLVLLAAAMGLVSWLVYRTSAEALHARQVTNRELLLQQYEQRRREERQKLDSDLLHNAILLANLAQSQHQSSPLRALPAVMNTMIAGPTPFAYLTVLPLNSDPGRRLNGWIYWHMATKINIDDDALTKIGDQRADERNAEFMQINSPFGMPWQSKSLDGHPLPFGEAEQKQFASMQLLDSAADEIDWQGHHLRRVMLKAPISRTRFQMSPPAWPDSTGPNRSAGSIRQKPRDEDDDESKKTKTAKSSVTNRPKNPPWTPPPSAPPPRMPDREATSPPMFIQSTADTSRRDEALAALDAELAGELARLDNDSRQTRHGILLRLFWINLGTFGALYTGGLLLIAFGLAPLRRLSDAVSRVSEKDFELRYQGPEPPTELVPIVERLKHTLAMLRRAFDREKQATADISHELRTPLAGLLATLEVALRKPRSSEDYRKTLEECREIVRQMTCMAERLLALNSLDSRCDSLRPEKFDAAELTEQCATLMRPLARASELELTVHNGQPVPITTDPDKLREIMANLVHNAIEYNHPHGSVDVTIKPWESGLELEVADTGVGIPAESQDKIFERFYRADPSRQATSLHAGLGLAIVRGYVDLMGGTISVESELGHGSKFRVRLPSLSAKGSNGREHS